MAHNIPYFNSGPSLASLPTEISEQIYAYLTPTILTRLAKVSKAVYASVQSPLYRHTTISSYEKLQLFIRTLHSAATFDTWGEGISKNIVSLCISVDPNAGARPTAVMLSRMISVIGRYCPTVKITLDIKNGSCDAQPICSFEGATFSRVSRLILHVGIVAVGAGSTSSGGPSASSRSQVIPARRFPMNDYRAVGRGVCRPNKKFWSGIFNGQSFPDLSEVEIRHDAGIGGAGSTWNPTPVVFDNGDLKGLDKITNLIVESAPELNDSVLMSALNFAHKLKVLELCNINGLSYEALSQLLPHALPNLTHFTLKIAANHGASAMARRQLENYQLSSPSNDSINPLPPHLCPLFRQFARNLQYLNLKAPYLCRDLFLDDVEKSKLEEVGVRADIGGAAGAPVLSSSGEEVRVDTIAINEIIKTFRRKREERRFRAAVNEALKEKGVKRGDRKYEVAITGVEYEEEQKRVKRARKINEQKWTRKIRVSQGMCRGGECWAEMGVLASLEEEGVNWLLGNEVLGLVARCAHGHVDTDQKYEDVFPGDLVTTDDEETPRYNRNYGHDFNDDL